MPAASETRQHFRRNMDDFVASLIFRKAYEARAAIVSMTRYSKPIIVHYTAMRLQKSTSDSRSRVTAILKQRNLFTRFYFMLLYVSADAISKSSICRSFVLYQATLLIFLRWQSSPRLLRSPRPCSAQRTHQRRSPRWIQVL